MAGARSVYDPAMLYLFDLDGTVIRSFMRDGGADPEVAYDLVELLPGRRDRLHELVSQGHEVGFVTNQGGAAFGYQTKQQVMAKILGVFRSLELPRQPHVIVGPIADVDLTGHATAFVALCHPNATIEELRVDDGWRKPGGGMIVEAMRLYGVDAGATVYVGDRPEDRGAADVAGCSFYWADDFFGRS